MTTSDLSRRAFLAMAAAAPFAASSALRGAKNVPVGLELYAPYLEWTPETARSVRKVLDDSGLKCRSTHNNGPSFTPDGLKKAIELNQIIGSTYIIMASAPSVTSLDGWKGVADQLTAVAAQLKPMGMATGYHNH